MSTMAIIFRLHANQDASLSVAGSGLSRRGEQAEHFSVSISLMRRTPGSVLHHVTGMTANMGNNGQVCDMERYKLRDTGNGKQAAIHHLTVACY